MKKVSLNKLLLIVGLFICFIFIGLWLYLVNGTGHKVVNGIVVSELLIVVSDEKYNIDYCKLLKKATTNDVNSIKQLALLDFYDGASYDHGIVVVDLIELIGEDKFIHSLKTINIEQKKWIKGYIEVGLEYRDNQNLQAQTLKEVFPKIYDFLN